LNPNRVLCFECTSSFEVIPPSDQEYCIPREKPKTNDYVLRAYGCDESHHKNSVYWEKKDYADIQYSGNHTRHYEDASAKRKRQDSDLSRN
jgi:hypothetical protein